MLQSDWSFDNSAKAWCVTKLDLGLMKNKKWGFGPRDLWSTVGSTMVNYQSNMIDRVAEQVETGKEDNRYLIKNCCILSSRPKGLNSRVPYWQSVPIIHWGVSIFLWGNHTGEAEESPSALVLRWWVKKIKDLAFWRFFNQGRLLITHIWGSVRLVLLSAD